MKTPCAVAEAGSREVNRDEVPDLVAWLMDDSVPEADRAALLAGMARRGETAGEIAGFVRVLREKMVPLRPRPVEAMDLCGTGGDGRHTFNVSTCASFIVASAGVPVVKHGNRGVSSKSGSFDVLEILGIQIGADPDEASRSLERHGICFLFAPHYHPAFKHLAPVRKAAAAMGSRTIFNLLGPLLNPATPSCQLIGVPAPELVPKYAEAAAALGLARAAIVSGRAGDGGGMDEVSTSGDTLCHARFGGELRVLELRPGDLVPPCADAAALTVSDASASAAVIEKILSGEVDGPCAELVLANAGVALWVAGKAAEAPAGVALARETVLSGAAGRLLASLKGSA